MAFEYLLLLGSLLIGSDLAWAEVHWTPLGPSWTWHLLIYALVLLPLAYRFDSAAVLSLALTSIAAWRGVSLSVAASRAGAEAAATLRGNAIVVGLAFLVAAALTRASRRKPHFETIYANLGLLLLFGGLLSGTMMHGGWEVQPSGEWRAWLATLAAATALVVPVAWRLRRASYFSLALIAGWLGLIRLSLESRDEVGIAFFVAATALGVVVLLLRVRRRFREEGR
jgi:hypothetical protein